MTAVVDLPVRAYRYARQVLDTSANIGDSALLIPARVDAEIACVDRDPHWWPYPEANIEQQRRVTVVKSLIGGADDRQMAVRRVPIDRTTQFLKSDDGTPTPAISVSQLRDTVSFADVRLIKSDTDGFDQHIVPAPYPFWDVALAHDSDVVGQACVRSLFTPTGALRPEE